MPDDSRTEEERLAELIALLPPAPEPWVEMAARIPRTERDLADVQRRLEEDALLREALRRDPDRALREAGLEASPELIARLQGLLGDD